MSQGLESDLPEAERLTDDSDRATEQESRTLAIALFEASTRAKRQQEARSDGTYAVIDCVDCGTEIGIGRLNVAIRNRYCVVCAARQEREERR